MTNAGARPDPSCLSMLNPDGELSVAPEFADFLPDADLLRQMYRDMVLTRRFDVEATALQRQGELALWVSSRGQEAAQVGSGRAAAASDYVVPSYRDHGVLRTRGIELTDMLPLFRGLDHGGWDTRKYNTHLYTLVVGAQVLPAVGYAQGIQHDRRRGLPADEAVSVYFGDGASSEGDVNEAMVFAAASNAPVVFICQNNQWAISEPTTRQTPVPIFRRGQGFGIPSIQVDGNDVISCYAVAKQAFARARADQGPSLIEAFTYRMGAHTTADDPTRYRTKEQEQEWARRDPIDRLRRYLAAQQIADDAFFAEVEAESEAYGEQIRGFCRTLVDPQLSDFFAHVYATDHSLVAAERDSWAHFTAGGSAFNQLDQVADDGAANVAGTGAPAGGVPASAGAGGVYATAGTATMPAGAPGIPAGASPMPAMSPSNGTAAMPAGTSGMPAGASPTPAGATPTPAMSASNGTAAHTANPASHGITRAASSSASGAAIPPPEVPVGRGSVVAR